MPPLQRSMIKAAPMWLRRRMLLRLSKRLVQSSYRGSRAISQLRAGTARVELRASVFCTVREKVPHPLCGFYAAAFTRLLALFDIGASTEVIGCRATGEPTCLLSVSLANGQPAEPRPVEAL
jgi:predicted hydrocarbon binding protein